MAEAVPKPFTVTGLFNDRPRRAINGTARHTRTNRFDSRKLCSQNDFVNSTQLGRDFTGDQNTGQVAHIKARFCAPIYEHERAFLDPPFPGDSMGKRRPWPDSNNRLERTPNTPELAYLMLNVRGHQSFRHFGGQCGTNKVKGPFRQMDRSTNFRHLIPVFDLPQRFDPFGGRNQFHSVQLRREKVELVFT